METLNQFKTFSQLDKEYKIKRCIAAKLRRKSEKSEIRRYEAEKGLKLTVRIKDDDYKIIKVVARSNYEPKANEIIIHNLKTDERIVKRFNTFKNAGEYFSGFFKKDYIKLTEKAGVFTLDLPRCSIKHHLV